MTLTFENEHDIIVYALEKIISYSRKHQYIFVAQSVWWIASVIGLSEGLATHIDNLRIQREVMTVSTSITDQPENQETVKPRSIPSCSVVGLGTGLVHPDRIPQLDTAVNHSFEVENSEPELDRASLILQSASRFISQSRKDRRALERKPCALSRTRSGKILAKPLTKKQWNRLQAIPKDTISKYLESRKKWYKLREITRRRNILDSIWTPDLSRINLRS